MSKSDDATLNSLEQTSLPVAVTIEVALLRPGELAGYELLLLQRPVPPDVGRFALPGSALAAEDATLEEAARRVARDASGLMLSDVMQVGAFGDRGRDPRVRSVSILYLAFLSAQPTSGEQPEAEGGCWFPLSHLPSPLAFDHDRLVRTLLAVDALRSRAATVDAVSRKVSSSGAISYEDERYYVGRRLAGQRVHLTVLPDCLLIDHRSGFQKEVKRTGR